jgi:RNA-binding protein
MQSLTGKQKRFLRSESNALTPVFSVGKNGLTTTWVDELVLALNKRELMKVNLQQNATITPAEVAAYIHDHSDITVVQIVGRTLILFLPAQEAKYADVSLKVNKLA